MDIKTVSRRSFMGVVAATLSRPSLFGALQQRPEKPKLTQTEYDGMAKLASNENPYGPSESTLKAMTDVWKYSNRYQYPDGGIVDAIAEHHGVKPENVVIGHGSTEILKLCDEAFLRDHRIAVGPSPTYETVYKYATASRAESIQLPLLKDRGYATDIKGIIHAVKANVRDVGLVYICNPNNPTGVIVPKDEIKMLVDAVPEDIPILIDEAYHHFVDNPQYEESIKYVKEGRKVIVARTFSKIAALAGMRLGYSIATKEVSDHMRKFSLGLENALVRYGAAAAMKDKANEVKVKALNKQVRERTTKELTAMGWAVIPSETNFFMVNVKKEVGPLEDEFKKRKVLVGRPFPPMTEWLRVSVGTQDEMNRFMAAFKEILGNKAPAAAAPTTTGGA